MLNRIRNAHSVVALEKANNPIIGFYALYLRNKGIDPASEKGLEAIAGFREILMTATIADAETAFNQLGVEHQDLFTIYDIGYKNWLKDKEEASRAKKIPPEEQTPLQRVLDRIDGGRK